MVDLEKDTTLRTREMQVVEWRLLCLLPALLDVLRGLATTTSTSDMEGTLVPASERSPDLSMGDSSSISVNLFSVKMNLVGVVMVSLPTTDGGAETTATVLDVVVKAVKAAAETVSIGV